jgi:hypothetical protein
MMSESFEYYMVRVRRSDADPEHVTGHVERLGTGEKRGFESERDLARLVATWPVETRGVSPDSTDSVVHPVDRRTTDD